MVYFSWLAGDWSFFKGRWDVGNYLAIAQNGYEYHPCTAETKSECGTIGWFPGWPLLLAFFRLLGFDLNTVAKLLPSLVGGFTIRPKVNLNTLII